MEGGRRGSRQRSSRPRECCMAAQCGWLLHDTDPPCCHYQHLPSLLPSCSTPLGCSPTSSPPIPVPPPPAAGILRRMRLSGPPTRTSLTTLTQLKSPRWVVPGLLASGLAARCCLHACRLHAACLDAIEVALCVPPTAAAHCRPSFPTVPVNCLLPQEVANFFVSEAWKI